MELESLSYQELTERIGYFFATLFKSRNKHIFVLLHRHYQMEFLGPFRLGTINMAYYFDKVLGSAPGLVKKEKVEVFLGLCKNGRCYMSLVEVA